LFTGLFLVNDGFQRCGRGAVASSGIEIYEINFCHKCFIAGLSDVLAGAALGAILGALATALNS
jgi:hypothetical protein